MTEEEHQYEHHRRLEGWIERLEERLSKIEIEIHSQKAVRETRTREVGSILRWLTLPMLIGLLEAVRNIFVEKK